MFELKFNLKGTINIKEFLHDSVNYKFHCMSSNIHD